MITRAQIRRQLRQSGGIMNVVPRQEYGIGSSLKKFVRKIIPKEAAKVATVAAPFVAPFNPALAAGMAGLGSFQQTGRIGPSVGRGLAMYGMGQGARYLGGAGFQGNPFTSGGAFTPSGFKGGFSSPLSASKSASLFGANYGDLGISGPARSGKTPGILGKLGLTKGGGSMMPTALGGITGASLLTYFMSKGKTEEEAEGLAQDVYRGEGLGLDLIRADMKKYQSGVLSASQARDKGYHFLTPQTYLGAQGGRVGLASGSPRFDPPTFSEGVKQMYVSDDLGALPKKGGGVLPEDMGKLKKENFDSEKDYKRYLKRLNKKAQGGRIGFADGDEDPIIKKLRILPDTLDKIAEKIAPLLGYEPEDIEKLIKERAKEAQGGRIGKFGGGIGAAMPRIPTGMPRVNAGGITELDYRQEGGFVPMGVKEKADDVPAMLSKNEFVMTADAVKAAGGGSIEKGAQRMYDTMKKLENRIA